MATRFRELLLPWDGQPQEAVETSRSGVAAKLRAFYSPPLFAAGNSIGVATTAAGVAFDTQGSKSLLVGSGLTDGKFTVMAGIYVSDGADPDAAGEYIYAADYNGSNEPFVMRLNASRQLYTGSFTGGGVTHASSLTLNSYAVAYSLAGAAGASEPWYVGHIVGGVDTSSTSTFVGASRISRPVRIGSFANSGAPARYYSKPIVWVAEFDGHLSAEERRIVAENPWAVLLAPRTIWVPVSAGGGGTPVGLSTETDTSIALSALQIAATGQASETDAALALAGVAVSATGRADETDTALPLAAVQIAAIGLATETDTALALDAGAASAVGRADEADAAFALAAVQIGTVGLAAETDAALALTGIAGTAPGIASETDAAFALAAVQIATTGLAEESDEALAPGSVDAGVVVSLSGRPKSRAKRLRYQDYDVPLSPEVLTSTIPQDTPPTGIEPAPSLSKLKPASKLATRPAKVKAPQVEAPAPAPVATPEPQAAPPVIPASAVAAAVLAVAKPARAVALADILLADDMTHDELLQAVKLLARLHMGPQLRRDMPKPRLIRG